MPISIGSKIYEKISFSLEAEFEKVVYQLSDKIFGDNTIYLDIKKKIKGNNIGAIPDGYLIDMTIVGDPKLYVIENEIVSHDPFRHIGVQMLRFVTSFEDEKLKVRNFLMEEISKHNELLQKLKHACEESKSRNIDNYLDKAVYNDFKGLVIIDEARTQLFKVLEKINANISVLEVKTYRTIGNEYAYEYDTLYESEEEAIQISTSDSKSNEYEAKIKRRKRRAECDTIVVPAKEDGFVEEFLNNNRWFKIRIGAAMKDKIKYIAAYQVAPISAVTHIAEVQEIKPYQDTGKYIVHFKGDAWEIESKKIKDTNRSPQGPVYVKYQDLLENEYFDESLEY